MIKSTIELRVDSDKPLSAGVSLGFLVSIKGKCLNFGLINEFNIWIY